MAHRFPLSVVIPTLNGPDQLMKSVTSILAGTYRAFEIIIVDQREDDLSAAAIGPLLQDDNPRVLLVRDQALGSSHARNVGIAASEGEVIAFTYDDCEAADGWLEQIAVAFETDPGAGAACGAVIPAPFDASTGFIVGFTPRRRVRWTGRLAKVRDAGIGANMSFRRKALDQVGGWDELLGAGSFFEGAGDRDLVYRVLGAGFALLHLPDARVVHRGFRDWHVGRGLMRGRFRGIGAA